MMRRRMDMMELTPRDQVLILLGKPSCGINFSQLTASSKRKDQTPRKLNQKTTFWLEGQRICRDTFMFLHVIGSPKRLTDLLHHYTENGLQPTKKEIGREKVQYSVVHI